MVISTDVLDADRGFTDDERYTLNTIQSHLSFGEREHCKTWFEAVLTYVKENLVPQAVPQVEKLLVKGMNKTSVTPGESKLCYDILTSTPNVGQWGVLLLKGRMPLSKDTVKFLARALPDELMFYRPETLTRKQVLRTVRNLKGFTPLLELSVALDPVEVIDKFTEDKHWQLRLASSHSRPWVDPWWWREYVSDAVSQVRNTYNFGEDLPDSWVIETAFNYPDRVVGLMELLARHTTGFFRVVPLQRNEIGHP